jgi:hypothetical protein
MHKGNDEEPVLWRSGLFDVTFASYLTGQLYLYALTAALPAIAGILT